MKYVGNEYITPRGRLKVISCDSDGLLTLELITSKDTEYSYIVQDSFLDMVEDLAAQGAIIELNRPGREL